MNLDATQLAARDQFARQSQHYGKGHVLQRVDDLEAALPWLRLPASATVLDVATGGGHTGLFFAKLGHQVTVSDLTQSMLDNAAQAAAELGLAVSTRLHPAERMPYPDATFDLVTCRIAPHHFTAPAEFVREVARVLKPGGQFLLIDGTVEDDQPEAEEWMHQVEKLRDPSHNRLLTPRTWRALCEAAGLAVEQAQVSLFKQPDLEWYFAVAATPEANLRQVLELIDRAPEPARRLFRLADEDGKIVWWWQRLTLVAARPVSPLSMNKTRFITTAEALKEDYKGRTNYWLSRPEVCEAKDLQLCRAVLPAGEGHNFHTHPELEEIIYVLEGEVEQWVEREKRILKPGEVAHIPKGIVHATFNPSAKDAVILAILSPAATKGPFLVDVSGEEPWKSVRAQV